MRVSEGLRKLIKPYNQFRSLAPCIKKALEIGLFSCRDTQMIPFFVSAIAPCRVFGSIYVALHISLLFFT